MKIPMGIPTWLNVIQKPRISVPCKLLIKFNFAVPFLEDLFLDFLEDLFIYSLQDLHE